MNMYEESNPWLRIPTAILWTITIAFSLLFGLYVGIAFKSELVKNWEFFAMFMSSVILFITTAVLIWGWKAMHSEIKRPNVYLTLEIVCTIALVLSFFGLFLETVKPIALIVDALISFVTFSSFVSICYEKRVHQVLSEQ